MNTNALQSSGFFADYTDALTPIDLVEESQTAPSSVTNGIGVAGSPSERIQVRVAGTLVVTRDRDGAQVTLHFIDNEVKWVRCRSIDSGTATGITVYWE